MAPQTINLPLIDAAEVFGVSSAQPQSINLPLIDVGSVFAPSISMPSDPDVELIVGGSTVEGAFARTFEDQLADTGSFSFQLLRDEFLEDPISMLDEVKFRLNGSARFLGIVEELDHVALAQGEDADQVVTISGRGALAALQRAGLVWPSRGVGALPIEDVRSHSWVSPDFDPVAAGWPLAKVVNLQQWYADTEAPRPHIYPNPTGTWIWGNVPGVTADDAPQGICLFRSPVITLTETRMTRHFMSPDDVGRFWFDAAEATWFAGSGIAQFVDYEWSDGDHYVAAKVANKTDVPGENNPGGYLAVGYTLTADGLLDEKIYETDATWRCLPYPVRAPGFTVGKLERLQFDENDISDWTLAFTDTKDTAGKAWAFQREITLNVGRNLLQVQQELMDVHADIACAPGSKTLRAWNRGTRGRVTSVTLQQTTDPDTSDFLSLNHHGKAAGINKWLIRYDGGHTTHETGSADRVGYLEVGHIKDEEVAKEYAASLSRLTHSFSTSAVLYPRGEATTPYEAFEVGDWITCPNEDGDDELMRVASIAWVEDENGDVTWPITLRDVHLEIEENLAVVQQRSAMGIAVGGARIASRAGTPASTAQQLTALDVAEFSMHDAAGGLPTGLGIARRAVKSGNAVAIVATLTLVDDDVPTTTATTFNVYLNGVVLGSLVTIAAGETEAELPLSIEPIIANVDRARPELVSVADEVAGIDIQVKAI